MKNNKNTLLIDKRIKPLFTRYLIDNIFDNLNYIIRNTTNFNEDILMVYLSKYNEIEEPTDHIKLYTTTIKSNDVVNHTIYFSQVINNQIKLLEKPIICVDTDSSEYVGRYEFDGNKLLLISLSRKIDKEDHIHSLKI